MISNGRTIFRGSSSMAALNENTTDTIETHKTDIFESKLFFASFLLILIVAAVMNITLALIFMANKTLRRMTSNNLLISLTVSDLLVASGGIAVLITAVDESSETKALFICLYFVGFLTASALNLLFISFEKLFAVAFPLRYSVHIKERVVRFMIAFTWIFVVLVDITLAVKLTQISENITTSATHGVITIMICVASLTTVVLIAVNVLIYRAVRRQVKRLTAITVTIKTASVSRVYGILQSQKTRATYLCFAMVAAFSICWVPFIVSSLLHLTNHNQHEMFFDVAFFIILLTPVLDPIFYILLKKDIRLAFNTTFNQCFKNLRSQECQQDHTDSMLMLGASNRGLQLKSTTIEGQRQNLHHANQRRLNLKRSAVCPTENMTDP